MADTMYGGFPSTGGEPTEENNTDPYGALNNATARPRFPGLYVGNLTWWTTDQDVINAINSVGVADIQEVKFFENRNNGQSKGFCVVTFNSEVSLPIVMDKLPKLELHGQNPVVTPYNRQNLNLFESQTKARPQINPNNGPNSHAAGVMGISSISGVHAGTQGLPYSGINNYNQGAGPGGVGPRGPSSYHGGNMRLPMRGSWQGGMRSSMPNAMNNGPMIPGGHQMNRMRFMQPQAWSQQTPWHPPTSSRSPPPSSRHPPPSSRTPPPSSWHPLPSSRSPPPSSRHPPPSSRNSPPPSRTRDEDSKSSRSREDRSSRREERSSRKEEKSARREKGHRSSERGRSRSKERSRDRSRERKDRRDRRERY